jgi:mercuric ion transport protein
MSESRKGRVALAAGGFAAVLASACCLGPLILVALGLSGAWIGNLAVLEPYRPVFMIVAVVALIVAYRRIFRRTQACASEDICAAPQTNKAYKILFGVVAVLVLIALAFPYVLPLLY